MEKKAFKRREGLLFMIDLDHVLLYQARRLVNGANTHHLKGLIFHYEQAVSLHNERWPKYKTYNRGPELELRLFVIQEGMREFCGWA